MKRGTMTGALLLAAIACGSSTQSVDAEPAASPAPPPGVDPTTSDAAALDAALTQDATPTPTQDGAPPPEDASKPDACAKPDVPACNKRGFDDAACSVSAPPSTPYGCANDIGNGCTELSNGNGWCCPTPVAPSCSDGDPFCVNKGAAACGLTRGCLGPAPGCQHFAADGIWCCP